MAEQQAQFWLEGYAVLGDGTDPEQASGVVLTVDPSEVAVEAPMPPNAVLAEAPMGEYDVLELAVFDSPVARVRFCVHEDGEVGSVSAVQRVGESDLADAAVVPVLVQAALEELWRSGAEQVATVVPQEQEQIYLEDGWSPAESLG